MKKLWRCGTTKIRTIDKNKLFGRFMQARSAFHFEIRDHIINFNSHLIA